MILITVPHSVCIKNASDQYKRNCDTNALNAATIMASIMKNNHINFKMLVSDVFRPMLDANRIASRNVSKMRNELSNLISTANLVIDVHSFPHSLKSSVEIFFLFINLDQFLIEKSIVDNLKKHSITCKVIQGDIKK
jgi:hypothetical protein